jgi:hypothetical protein
VIENLLSAAIIGACSGAVLLFYLRGQVAVLVRRMEAQSEKLGRVELDIEKLRGERLRCVNESITRYAAKVDVERQITTLAAEQSRRSRELYDKLDAFRDGLQGSFDGKMAGVFARLNEVADAVARIQGSPKQ